MEEKNPFTAVDRKKDTLQEVDIPVSKSTAKRSLHQSKCPKIQANKPQKQKGLIGFHSMERSTWTRMMKREEYEEGKELLMT